MDVYTHICFKSIWISLTIFAFNVWTWLCTLCTSFLLKLRIWAMVKRKRQASFNVLTFNMSELLNSYKVQSIMQYTEHVQGLYIKHPLRQTEVLRSKIIVSLKTVVISSTGFPKTENVNWNTPTSAKYEKWDDTEMEEARKRTLTTKPWGLKQEDEQRGSRKASPC